MCKGGGSDAQEFYADDVAMCSVRKLTAGTINGTTSAAKVSKAFSTYMQNGPGPHCL